MLMGSVWHSTHAAERAAERYGIVASREAWRDLVLDIIASAAAEATACVLMRRCEDGKELWLGRLAGTPVVACYAPATATVVTIFRVNGQWSPYQKGTNQRFGLGRARRERVREEVWE